MKIAIIINSSWNIYNFRIGLVRHFLEQGHTVVTIAPEDAYSAKLTALGCRHFSVEMIASGMNPLTDSQLIYRLWKILRHERPDVVLSYTIKPNIYASLVCGGLRIPIIANVSGLGTVFLWKGSVKTIATSLYAFAFRFTSWVFFQNHEDQAEFFRFVKIQSHKSSLLPGSGVDTQRFQHNPHFQGHHPPVFLMISRLLVEKGIYDYVEAIRLFRKKGGQAIFRLLGALDEGHSRAISRAELNGWLEEGLFEYTSHLEDVRPAIAASDVVVLPSYREGTPRTLLEAGAMGRPLVATDVPGCRQAVADGENGFLCKPQNPEDLAQKLLLMCALSRAERLEMGTRARLFVEKNFDEKLVIGEYQQKIEELTGLV